MNANPRRQETLSLCLSFFLSDSNRPWSIFLISCRFFSSLHPCLWPPRFAFQASSSRHQPSRIRGCCRPSVCSRRSLLSPPPVSPAEVLPLSSWRPQYSFAQASTDLLSKWTGSASSCLPKLSLCCCWTLPEGAALKHRAMFWQSLKT